jgi:SAM-dependent methyltransferase
LDPIRKEEFEFSVFYLDSRRGGRLLELGCGAGAMLKLMQDLGWEVEGVDFDASAVARARAKGLKVHLGTLSDKRFPSGTFDAVVGSHFIEHVQEPAETLNECHRVLKPGGTLVLITPNADGWGRRFYGRDWRGLEPPRHLYIFTLSALAVICRRAGLDVVECRSVTRANGILKESRRLRREDGTQMGRSISWGVRLWEEVRGLAQWCASLVDSRAGEELLLIGRKGGDGAVPGCRGPAP